MRVKKVRLEVDFVLFCTDEMASLLGDEDETREYSVQKRGGDGRLLWTISWRCCVRFLSLFLVSHAAIKDTTSRLPSSYRDREGYWFASCVDEKGVEVAMQR